jgi:hypothetical protein
MEYGVEMGSGAKFHRDQFSSPEVYRGCTRHGNCISLRLIREVGKRNCDGENDAERASKCRLCCGMNDLRRLTASSSRQDC